jgi:serine/threonine protein phosphatase PrpC
MSREHNEDCFAIFPTTGEMGSEVSHIDLDEQGIVLIVADGMGGRKGGEVASALAVNEIRKFI